MIGRGAAGLAAGFWSRIRNGLLPADYETLELVVEVVILMMIAAAASIVFATWLAIVLGGLIGCVVLVWALNPTTRERSLGARPSAEPAGDFIGTPEPWLLVCHCQS
jgi:hypothetical protein